MVNKSFGDWLLFMLLSAIWGSSFILMKIGLTNHLTPYQVAAIRIATSGIVLFPVAIGALKKIPSAKIYYVFLSGFIGSLLPAFLFCLAEEKIDSSLAGTLNSLTPVFAISIGAVFFNIPASGQKITGAIIALAGCFLLLISKNNLQQNSELPYVLLVVLATVLYGTNVNLVAKHLGGIPSLQITAVALVLNAIPAVVILYFTNFFSNAFQNKSLLIGTGAAVVLGIGGTAIATFLFYALVKRAGGFFASMVTYGIPFIAIGWGIYFGESFNLAQAGSLFIILTGIYFANKKEKQPVISTL